MKFSFRAGTIASFGFEMPFDVRDVFAVLLYCVRKLIPTASADNKIASAESCKCTKCSQDPTGDRLTAHIQSGLPVLIDMGSCFNNGARH